MKVQLTLYADPTNVHLHLAEGDEFYVERTDSPDIGTYCVLKVGGANIYLKPEHEDLLARGMAPPTKETP